MTRIVNVGKELVGRWVKSSDWEPFNWLPQLSYFENDFFLAASGLLLLANYSKGVLHSFVVLPFSLISYLTSFPSCRRDSGIIVSP